MPVDKIHFHTKFLRGLTDTEYFKDFAAFDVTNSPQDLAHFNRIKVFAMSALRGESLLGKNVENKGSYSCYDTWHYHSGPWSDVSEASSAKIDKENPLGATSGPAIHYTWHGNLNEVVIIGYSPIKHDRPFPQLHKPNNPLKARVRSLDDPYDDNELEDLTDILNPTPSE